MTLVILWTALGLLCGCLIANAANRNLCYQIVKKLLTNNLKHEKIVYRESNSLLFLSIIRWIVILSWKGAMLFVMAFQVSLRGYLKKCLIIHSLNPLQLCPNHD